MKSLHLKDQLKICDGGLGACRGLSRQAAASGPQAWLGAVSRTKDFRNAIRSVWCSRAAFEYLNQTRAVKLPISFWEGVRNAVTGT